MHSHHTFLKVVNYDGICQAVPPSGSTVKYQVLHINFFVDFGETAHLIVYKFTKMHFSLIFYITPMNIIMMIIITVIRMKVMNHLSYRKSYTIPQIQKHNKNADFHMFYFFPCSLALSIFFFPDTPQRVFSPPKSETLIVRLILPI